MIAPPARSRPTNARVFPPICPIAMPSGSGPLLSERVSTKIPEVAGSAELKEPVEAANCSICDPLSKTMVPSALRMLKDRAPYA